MPRSAPTVESTLLGGLKLRLDQIRASLHAGARVSRRRCPTTCAHDWVSKDGQARVEVRPKGDQNDNEAMRRFAAAVLEVAPDATGTPILIQESAKTIVRAFLQAGAFALAAHHAHLFLALRRVGDVLVTLVPLLLAGVVTLELTVLVGLPLNFANIIALAAAARRRRRLQDLLRAGMAGRGDEPACFIAHSRRAVQRATTASAFASLWLSNHPGTSSMGKLLSLSLITTLIAAVLFQPILMGPPRQAVRTSRRMTEPTYNRMISKSQTARSRRSRRKRKNSTPLAQPPLHHLGTAHHLADDGGDLRRSEIELLVERLDRIEDLGMAEMRVGERRDLRAEIGDQLLVLMVQPIVLARLVIKEGARIGRRERHLDGVRVDLLGEAYRLLDRLLGLARQAENERAVDDDAEIVAILGEAASDVDPHALLDVVKNLLIAGFVPDQQQPAARCPA